MIFADKLIRLRKKSGWSQEELAEQMKVSRQSVSKWEGAQSVPDLEKMIRLSELFAVSLDYLLKDEIEEDEGIVEKEISSIRRVSMEEASAFLAVKELTAKPIAIGVFLCICSPICLLMLAVRCEMPDSRLGENMAAGLGMIILLGCVAAAVAIFISCRSKTSSYDYLENEAFETEYGVVGMVKKYKEQYKNSCTRNNIIGVSLCILAIVPLFGAAAVNDKNDLLMVGTLCMTLVLVGIGVMFLVRSGIIWASYEKLLQEGDYTLPKKQTRRFYEPISAAYWLIFTAVYLVYSLATENWKTSWIIWVAAGLLYPALLALVQVVVQKKE